MNSRQKFCLFCISALLLIIAVGCGTNAANPTMAGFWADPDNNVTTVQDQGGTLVAVSVFDLNQSNGQNLLVSTTFAYRQLTWRYCPTPKPCLTLQTTSFKGNTLDVNWLNEKGESGQMTLKRVDKGTK
jgi:hypothetical protein